MTGDSVLRTEPAICFLTDEKYILPTKVAICSLIKNWETQKDLYIYVFGSGQCEKEFAASKWVLPDNIQLRFAHIKINDSLQGNGRVPFVALAKFDIPSLIDHEKVLYLDSDVVVLRDLSELFQLDMGNHAVGAVPNGDKAAIALRPHSKYGSGVLLFLVDMYRRQNVSERLWKYVSEPNFFKNNDKYIFNICLQDDFFDLETKYNLTPYDGLLNDLETQVAIVHFWGSEKPWNSDAPSNKKIWIKYYTELKTLSVGTK